MGELRLFADRAMEGRDLFDGPCVLAATFSYAYPASWPEKRKAAVIHKASKPDLSNLLKLCEDALNGCVYTDDALIVSILATKCYGPKPELVLTISQIDEPWRRR